MDRVASVACPIMVVGVVMLVRRLPHPSIQRNARRCRKWVISRPTATIAPCLLHLDKQTLVTAAGRSASCHKQTLARLFDYLVSRDLQALRHSKAKDSGRLEVDHHFELGWLQHGHLGEFLAGGWQLHRPGAQGRNYRLELLPPAQGLLPEQHAARWRRNCNAPAHSGLMPIAASVFRQNSACERPSAAASSGVPPATVNSSLLIFSCSALSLSTLLTAALMRVTT